MYWKNQTSKRMDTTAFKEAPSRHRRQFRERNYKPGVPTGQEKNNG